MYFNSTGKRISSKIKAYNKIIFQNMVHIHLSALTNTKYELDYFRQFFPGLQSFLNHFSIPGVTFACRTQEIHGKPLVSYGNRKTCELGDYFIIIKYLYRGTIIGKKGIIYQFKRTHKKYWSIDQKQLTLLKDWPTFSFGRTLHKTNSFNLRPSQTEFGSFALISNPSHRLRSHVIGTAFDIFNIQNQNKILVSDYYKFFPYSIFSYVKLLSWEIGEPILPNTDIADLINALYRYVDWQDDPPEEFIQFERKGEKKEFWAVEITVNYEFDKS
jgi:hypothetical protein